MADKTDLRVTKTRRAIRAAFLELIARKPVHKITVTELARRAEIGKGTFYLHYLDIFDLYDQLVEDTVQKIAGSFDPYPDLFVDPENFVRTFLFSQVEPMGKSLTVGERALLAEKNMKFCTRYPQCFIDAFRAQIYRVGKLRPCEENDIKIEFLLTGMLSALIRFGTPTTEERQAFMVRFLAAVIRQTFPEFYPVEGPQDKTVRSG